jgi:hypothetical protein
MTDTRCVICLHSIDDARRACNAQPIADGQCCPDCDNLIVLPVRLARIGSTTIKQAVKVCAALQDAQARLVKKSQK